MKRVRWFASMIAAFCAVGIYSNLYAQEYRPPFGLEVVNWTGGACTGTHLLERADVEDAVFAWCGNKVQLYTNQGNAVWTSPAEFPGIVQDAVALDGNLYVALPDSIFSVNIENGQLRQQMFVSGQAGEIRSVEATVDNGSKLIVLHGNRISVYTTSQEGTISPLYFQDFIQISEMYQAYGGRVILSGIFLSGSDQKSMIVEARVSNNQLQTMSTIEMNDVRDAWRSRTRLVVMHGQAERKLSVYNLVDGQPGILLGSYTAASTFLLTKIISFEGNDVLVSVFGKGIGKFTLVNDVPVKQEHIDALWTAYGGSYFTESNAVLVALESERLRWKSLSSPNDERVVWNEPGNIVDFVTTYDASSRTYRSVVVDSRGYLWKIESGVFSGLLTGVGTDPHIVSLSHDRVAVFNSYTQQILVVDVSGNPTFVHQVVTPQYISSMSSYSFTRDPIVQSASVDATVAYIYAFGANNVLYVYEFDESDNTLIKRVDISLADSENLVSEAYGNRLYIARCLSDNTTVMSIYLLENNPTNPSQNVQFSLPNCVRRLTTYLQDLWVISGRDAYLFFFGNPLQPPTESVAYEGAFYLSDIETMGAMVVIAEYWLSIYSSESLDMFTERARFPIWSVSEMKASSEQLFVGGFYGFVMFRYTGDPVGIPDRYELDQRLYLPMIQ